MERQCLKEDILALPKRYRTQFINSLTGFKSANLVGTISKTGTTNLAIFSQIFHLGANPPLIGMIVRPAVVPRHTLINIRETGFYTLNHILPEWFDKAHQTSAKFKEGISEFTEVGLHESFGEIHPAPYVNESNIKIGLKLKQEIPIEINDTILLIGEIIEVIFPNGIQKEDGFLDLEKASSITVSGLDSYHQTIKLGRLAYAVPEEIPHPLPENLQ